MDAKRARNVLLINKCIVIYLERPTDKSAALAQLVEHFISNEKVRGSTPRCGFTF